MVVLKVKVSISAVGRLVEELEKVPNRFQIRTWPAGEDPRGYGRPQNFVRVLPGDRKFDGHKTEAHLELMETFPSRDPDHTMTGLEVSVGREMLNQLWDLLGIFPRATSNPDREEIAKWTEKVMETGKRLTELARGEANRNHLTSSILSDGGLLIQYAALLKEAAGIKS